MPIINLKMSSLPEEFPVESIISALTDLTEKHLKKKPNLTACTVQVIDHQFWFVNKTSLKSLNQNSFYLDIKVTDGTNLKNEKSEFVAAVFNYMKEVLPNLHSKSYIYIEEVKGDAYGFEGLTQEFRYIKA